MKNYIDKIALIDLKDKKLLGALSKGRDTWYLPGGKREEGEGDADTLVREIQEELGVTIDPLSLQLFGVYEAQAHGKPPGTIVRTTCYQAIYTGTPQPHQEIAKLGYFSYQERALFSEVNQFVFEELYQRGLIE